MADTSPRPITQTSRSTLHSECSSTCASDTDIEATAANIASHLKSVAQEKDLNIVDWDGEDDPEKALNWPSRKKWTYIILLSTLTLLTCVDSLFLLFSNCVCTNFSRSPFGSSMFAPGIPLVMAEFESTNENLASFVVSVYLLGYAFGPLVIAPMSELYGRLPVYQINTILFTAYYSNTIHYLRYYPNTIG
jgi:hypothetical protein